MARGVVSTPLISCSSVISIPTRIKRRVQKTFVGALSSAIDRDHAVIIVGLTPILGSGLANAKFSKLLSSYLYPYVSNKLF
jgi:hypothetical protein